MRAQGKRVLIEVGLREGNFRRDSRELVKNVEEA